jgi:hypothetical protein
VSGTSPFLGYSASDASWRFADDCQYESILFRNAVFHEGELFEVVSVSEGALGRSEMSALCVSGNVGTLEQESVYVGEYTALQIVAFEANSHLREIRPMAFFWCGSLRSIAIPSFVDRLGSSCFSLCRSLCSVVFESPSRLTTIENGALWECQSLTHLSIPASVTAIKSEAFCGTGIRSIEVEEGSVSFRVQNELLVDFEVRSLIWVIGSPESIVIPSSIEELGERCCARQERLRTVEFESESTLRSIGRFAFAVCESLESIWIPSSVEVLCEGCFCSCSGLRAVTFGPESKLRLIEPQVFGDCRSLQSVPLPVSAEGIV